MKMEPIECSETSAISTQTSGRYPKVTYKTRRKLKIKNTLHVLDGLSVHHQESKTVHTASGICHTGSVAAQAEKKILFKDGEP